MFITVIYVVAGAVCAMLGVNGLKLYWWRYRQRRKVIQGEDDKRDFWLSLGAMFLGLAILVSGLSDFWPAL